MISSLQMKDSLFIYAAPTLRNLKPNPTKALESHYAFWYSEKKNYMDFPSTIKQFSRFSTLAGFWTTYANIPKPSEIPDSNLFLFRDGIEPLWEKNPSGGHFQIVLDKGSVSNCFKNLALAMIEGQFPVEASEILGIGVSVRPSKCWITVWNKSASDVETIQTIESGIQKILKLSSQVKLNYRRNNDFKEWNSIQAQKRILKELGRRTVA